MDEPLSLEQLSTCLDTEPRVLELFIAEGILTACDVRRAVFSVASVTRARRALRVQRAFDLEVGSLALVLELLDELDHLRQRARRLEAATAGPTLDL